MKIEIRNRRVGRMKQNIFVGIASLFGVLEIIIFYYMLTGKTFYIMDTSKKYFIGCFSIGFIMCCFGITRNLKELNWLNPLTIIACILGAVAFVVFYLLLFKEKSMSDARYRLGTICVFSIVILKWAMQMIKDYVIK